MKVLIIYYSQSGNTLLIARHIEKGLRKAGADVTVVKLKEASYEMMENYDLIGLGSPTWKADTPNMHHFIDRMPDQHGKHCFGFNTHGTLPHLYWPIVIPNLKNHGLLPSDTGTGTGTSQCPECRSLIIPQGIPTRPTAGKRKPSVMRWLSTARKSPPVISP